MKQYCRYCGHCHECDGGYYCGEKEQLMTEAQIKRVNHCPLFGYTFAGDVLRPDRQYQPRKQSTVPKAKQYSLFDKEGGE